MKITHNLNQKTKKDWEKLAKKFNSKSKIAEHLGIGLWGVSYWMNFHGVKTDGRVIPYNKKPIPSKKELINLYKTDSLLGISKHYGNVSNVTVKNWFKHYNIPLREHKDNQKLISSPKVKITNVKRYGNPNGLTTYHSKAELEVLSWLNSEGFNFATDRKILNGFELDGYDPNLKAAFEYCGLYYHSEFNKINKNSHVTKYHKCRDLGIKLFTIYENEWRDRQPQVKNFIMGALGKANHVLYARDCQLNISEAPEKEIMQFFDDHHIQGHPTTYKKCVVLYHNNNIIGAMSFGKHHRQNVGDEWILTRLCWKTGYKVLGGSQRMFSYRPKDKPIISWSDNRWSPFGGVYDRLGFTMEIEYAPSYDYTTSLGQLVHKQSMTKKTMNAHNGQKEHERALELGYARIWDCGKKKWVYYNT